MAMIETVINDKINVFHADFFLETKRGDAIVLIAHVDNKTKSGHIRLMLDESEVSELMGIFSGKRDV